MVSCKIIYKTPLICSGGVLRYDIRTADYVNGSPTVPVRFYQRHSWRRSAALTFWNKSLCSADTIADRTAWLGENYLICTSRECIDSETVAYQAISAEVLCTDFSEQFDFASGEKYTTLEIPINKRLTYAYRSCCWINLLPLQDTPSWSLNLAINTNRRLDGK